MKPNKHTVFQETQNFTLINITFLILILIFIILYFTMGGIEKIPIFIFILVAIFLLTPIVLFYKMETKLTYDDLKISYGIGLIKKTFKNDSLNYSNIEKDEIPWYFGVGIRITKDGIIYNAKPGTVIKISKTGSKKHIYIGTKKQEEFFKICKILES